MKARYPGKDLEKWMKSKTGMSDEDFHEMIKQNMMKQNLRNYRIQVHLCLGLLSRSLAD